MIGASGRQVDAAARQALDDHGVRHVDLQHIVQFDAGIPHGFGLRNRAWKAIEQEAIEAIRSSNSFLDQFNDEIVGNQLANVHDFFRRGPQRRTCSDDGAKHVARRDSWYAELGRNVGGLRALARARSPDEYESHSFLTLWRRL